MRTSQRTFAITVAAAVFGGVGVAGAAVVAQPASGAPEHGACVRQAAQVAKAEDALVRGVGTSCGQSKGSHRPHDVLGAAHR